LNFSMKVLNYTVYAIIRVFLFLGRWMPMAPTYFYMRRLGALAYRLAWRRRAIMLHNLELALGDRTTPAERERIARESMISLFLSLGELLHMDQIYAHWEQCFQVEGAEHIRPLVEAKKGFFGLGAHLGGWMLPGAIYCIFPELPWANLVARPIRNPYLQGLLEFVGKNFDGSIITTQGTGQQIVEAVERGELVGLYMDQESRRDMGVFVKFFGRDASSHVVPGYLAWKHHIPFIPVWHIRTGPGKFRIVFGEPIKYELTDDPDENNRRVAQAIASVLEDLIRQYPEQWLWAHNRWKRRPDGSKNLVEMKK
jgi:Kdo2-lipid IVA lauroyltransferase/acyltransferase